MYESPDIKSTYQKHDIGRSIYCATIALNPSCVVEIGTMRGYSAICIAQALRDLGGKRKIYCYDLWDEFKGAHCKREETERNIKKYKLDDYISLSRGNFHFLVSGIESGQVETGDMMHVDIGNTGATYKKMHEISSKKKCTIIMEGGTEQRDGVLWMKHFPPIIGSCPYVVIDERWPGLSRIL